MKQSAVEKVVVIGGGIIGCSIAWRLAQRGVKVVVIEKGEPVSQATWAAAGMLHPLIDSENPSLHHLARASIQLFPSFVDELRDATGIDAQLRMSGKLDVAFTADELEALRNRYSGVQDGDVTQLDAHSVRELEPALTSEIHAALLVNGDASVDNRKLGAAVERAARKHGVEFRTGVAVRKIVSTRSVFQHVELQNSLTVHGDAVVIAAGAWSGELTGLPIKIPTVPVRGQMLALEHESTLLQRMIVTLECYLVPRAGRRVLVGATVERVGFDVRTTESGINGLLRAAQRVVPEFRDANLVESWAGLRPGTPDDLPILGTDPQISGVYYATGHFRNGILLSPVTAELMADLIAFGKTSFDILPFSIGRFVVNVRDPHCDLCGAAMREFHCRITCPSCGYQRDCSDP